MSGGDSSLRKFAKDYYRGKISQDEYRRSRAAFFDQLTAAAAGDTGSDTTRRRDDEKTRPHYTREFRLHQPTPTPTPTREVTQTPPTAAAAHSVSGPGEPREGPSGGGRAKWFAVAGVCLTGLIAGFAYWQLSSDGASADNVVAGKDRPAAENPVSDGAAEEAEALIEAFLKENDWSAGSVAAFMQSWDGLSDDEREAASTSTWFQRLAVNLEERLLEQRAIAEAIGNGRTEDEKLFLAFGGHLGLEMGEPPAAGATQTEAPALEDGEEGAGTDAGDSTSTAAPVSESSPSGVGTTGGDKPGKLPVAEKVPAAGSPETNAAAAKTPRKEVKNTGTRSKTTEKAGSATTNCRADLGRSRRPYCSDTFADGASAPKLVVLPSGQFLMGSTSAPEEQPQHLVAIDKPFAISMFEVSYGEYEKFCKATGKACPKNPWSGSNYPVANVSWNDAREYTQWLSKTLGAKYRLPSEAEWEYAARGRTTSMYPFGDEILPTDARFSGMVKNTTPLENSSNSVNKNGFRLYHIVGNLREWTLDSWIQGYNAAPVDGSARTSDSVQAKVVRGGCYQDQADKLRSSAREGLGANVRDSMTGFRVVRELSQ